MHKSQSKLADWLRCLANLAPDEAKQNAASLATTLDLTLHQPASKKSKVVDADNTSKPVAKVDRTSVSSQNKPHPLISAEQPVYRTGEKLVRLFTSYHPNDADIVERITSLLMEKPCDYQLMFWDIERQGTHIDNFADIEREMEFADILLLFINQDRRQDSPFLSSISELHLFKELNVRSIGLALVTQDLSDFMEDIIIDTQKPLTGMAQEELYAHCDKIIDRINLWGAQLHLPLNPDNVAQLPPPKQAKIPAPKPLLADNQLRAFLTGHLSLKSTGVELDINQLVERGSRKQSLLPLPLLATSAFSHRFEVIVDLGGVMYLYQDDIDQIIKGLKALCGPENLKLVHCVNADVLYCEDDKPYQYPQVHTTVLIISLFGYQSARGYFNPSVLEKWQQLTGSFNRNGIKVCGLSPIPAKQFEATPLSWITFIDWDKQNTNTRQHVDLPSEQSAIAHWQLTWLESLGPQVFLLSQIVSVTVTCSLPLLRLLRIQFAPKAKPIDELKLLQSQTLQSMSIERLAWPPRLAALLRDCFKDNSPSLYSQVYQFVQRHRIQNNASDLLMFEEQCLNQTHIDTLTFEQIEQQSQQILATISWNETRSEAISAWMSRVYPNLPKPVQRVTSMSRAFAKAGQVLGRIPQGLVGARAENQWLLDSLETLDVDIQWYGDRLELTHMLNPPGGSVVSLSVIEAYGLFECSDKPSLECIQPRPNGETVRRMVSLQANRVSATNHFDANFALLVKDIVGNKLFLLQHTPALIICMDKDWQYAQQLQTMLADADYASTVLLIEQWQGFEIELLSCIKTAKKTASILTFSAEQMLDLPLHSLLSAEFNLFDDTDITAKTNLEGLKLSQWRDSNKLALREEQFADMPLLDECSPEQVTQYLEQYATALVELEGDGPTKALYHAIDAAEILTGMVSSTDKDKTTGELVIVIDYQGKAVVIRAEEHGLLPLMNADSLQQKTVEFMPLMEHEEFFSGSIRLAELQDESVQYWLGERKVGEIVQGSIVTPFKDNAEHYDVALEVMTAHLFSHDLEDGPLDDLSISDKDYMILQIDGEAGFIRLGEKQALKMYQAQIQEAIVKMQVLDVNLTMVQPDGIDVRFDENFSAFLPSAEMFWGCDDELGQQLQPYFAANPRFKVKLLQNDPVNFFPLVSHKLVHNDSFSEAVSGYKQGQQISVELFVQWEEAFIAILDNVIAHLPLEAIPAKHQETEEALEQYQQDSIQEVWIDKIDVANEIILLSAMPR